MDRPQRPRPAQALAKIAVRPRTAPPSPARTATRRAPSVPPRRAASTPPLSAASQPQRSAARPAGLPLQSSQVRRLLAPFRRKGPDGKLVYAKADRRRMYQLLLVTLLPAARAPHLSPELQAMAGELSVAAGAARASSPKDTMAALQAHFRKNPPHPALLADLNAVLATLVGELEAAVRAPAATVEPASGIAPPRPALMGVRPLTGGKVPDLLERAGVRFLDVGLQRNRR